MFLNPDFFNLTINTVFVIKAFFVLFLVFYNVFSLILLRQVQLMIATLPVPISPILKSLAILQIGVALALLLLVIGLF